jgi:hypothetical protein
MLNTALLLEISVCSGSLPRACGYCSSGEYLCSYSMQRCKSLLYRIHHSSVMIGESNGKQAESFGMHGLCLAVYGHQIM